MNNKMTLYLGADHNGFKAKEFFKKDLIKNGWTVIDLGNKKYQPLDDYPDFAKAVARKISKNLGSRGLLFCGSGQGMCIAANRYKNVRAALGYSPSAVSRSRQDNDSNILCLSAWEMSTREMTSVIDTWLQTKFSGLARHNRRLKKIDHA